MRTSDGRPHRPFSDSGRDCTSLIITSMRASSRHPAPRAGHVARATSRTHQALASRSAGTPFGVTGPRRCPFVTASAFRSLIVRRTRNDAHTARWCLNTGSTLNSGRAERNDADSTQNIRRHRPRGATVTIIHPRFGLLSHVAGNATGGPWAAGHCSLHACYVALSHHSPPHAVSSLFSLNPGMAGQDPVPPSRPRSPDRATAPRPDICTG